MILCSFKAINIKSNHQPVKTFKVLGERSSGTNYISRLVQKNLNFQKNLSKSTIFGHKHFIWWIGSSIDESTVQSLMGNGRFFEPKNFFFQNSQENLFIIVIRNPYDWIRSWFLTPYHIHPSKRRTFELFYSSPYNFYNFPKCDKVEFLENYHPQLKRGFSHLFELRKYKYINYQKVFDIAANVIFVNYEEVLKQPQEFLQTLSDTYCLEKKESFIPIDTYKGKPLKPYTNKEYFKLSNSDLKKINGLIDWELENSYGYFIQE